MTQEIKLIQIHKRRLGKLQEKAAKVGVQMDASVEMEIEDIQREINELEQTLNRRLQVLLLKAAMMGISADPSITIEIEDIQAYFGG